MSIENQDDFLRTAVRRYGPFVLRRCRAILRDPALAEDAFQQTFLTFTRWLQTQPETPDIEKVGGMVLTMAERTSIDLYRRRQRQERDMHDLTVSEKPSAGKWLYVDQLLDRLTPRERRIVELSVFGGLTAPEIARDLGLTPGAVRVAKLRALDKLKSIVQDDVTVRGGLGDE